MDKIILFAVASTVGSLLQGWHGGATAGALLYLNEEFGLEDNATIQGLIVSIAILGSLFSTLSAGPLADWVGRRIMLNISAMLFTLGSALMAWSPDVRVLIFGRLITGIAVGFASAVIPLHISESSPAEIRGTLLTFPQVSICVGMLLSFLFAFALSLTTQPNWRMMLGITIVPALVYFVLCTWYITESPRWLVSKGRILEAKKVLQRLRESDDVQAELALLVEGLGCSASEAVEEYILHSANVCPAGTIENEIEIMKPDDESPSWVAMPIANQETILSRTTSNMSSHGSLQRLLTPDPVVFLMGSLQATPAGSLRLTESLLSGIQVDQSDTPISTRGSTENVSNQFDREITTPLLASHEIEDIHGNDVSSGDIFSDHGSFHRRLSTASSNHNVHGSIGNMSTASCRVSEGDARLSDIGGGWEIGWKWSEEEGKVKRVFLHKQGMFGSMSSSTASLSRVASPLNSKQDIIVQASALVGNPAQSVEDKSAAEGAVGPAMVHPSCTALAGPAWLEIFQPGVKYALFIGVMLQLLQQFSGLNAALYYTPEILKESSGGASMFPGLSENSASLLACTISGFLMIPFTLWAVKLMDVSGRRTILLSTLPILTGCMILQISISLLMADGLIKATLSLLIMSTFICCFVMGFGPIPNILCAEIFPTRVRGLCNGICSAVMWLSTTVITYGFPTAVAKISINGVFGFFAAVSFFAWIFIYKKIPETKGMPLEVISELFADADQIKRQNGDDPEDVLDKDGCPV